MFGSFHSPQYSSRLDEGTLAAREVEVIGRDRGKVVAGARGWIGAGWLHLDAVMNSPAGTATMVLAAIETLAILYDCTRSQAEICTATTRTLLQDCGYMQATPLYWIEKSDWAVLQKELHTTTYAGPLGKVLRELRSSSGLLSEAEAAWLSGLSASRFRHQFRETLGTSFREARLHVKLNQTALLLRNTKMSIPEISEMLQYTDRTKLEKAFKRFYGMTPTAYRFETTR